MKEKISSFTSKIEHTEKQIEKYQIKLAIEKQNHEEVNEFDIYELDSFYKKQ